MPNEMRIDARRDFVRRGLPWLIAAAMLVFYAKTLNHWVSLSGLNDIARISHWTWGPRLNGPLFHLVTLPFGMLPATAVPIALNIFSAVCAALTLGLLARSVSLLPHDRTEAQQARERNDFFLLTIRSAWFPPLLAALLCGLQLTFWDDATNGGSEIFNLLLFAFVIWSLVEYRLDGRVWRLYSSAAVVGAGVAEGPAIMAFFPLFIVAVIWVRGLMFFNLQFLARMASYGLAGFSIFLALPLVSVISGADSLTFWQAIKFSLVPQFQVLKIYFLCVSNPTQYFGDLIMPLFISLMPLLVMSVRWKFGDSSKIGSSLASGMFHTIHAVFLGVCVWIAFDPPFSPREKGFGLPLYYLIALSTGYYAGYFLLVFGKKHPRAKEPKPFLTALVNKAVVIGVWLIGLLAIAGLFCKNAPLVRAANSDDLHQYSSLLAKNLPPQGAIVLSDDLAQIYLTQAALAGSARAKNYLMIDTAWLPYPQYHRYLHKISPQKWPLLITPQQTNALNVLGLIEMLAMLGHSNQLYYLHPSFGYYFEQFYLEPHGLVYKLKHLPNDTLLPPRPDARLIAENESFWQNAQTVLKPIEKAVAPPDPNAPQTFVQSQLAQLDIPDEPNVNASLIGTYGSRSLNFWGVELQRAGDLTDAAVSFKRAIQLNPNNIAAQTNLDLNEALVAGRHPSVDFSKISPDEVREFNNLITEDGPFDDPTFCFEYGFTLAQENGFFRQALAPFNRVYQLDPRFLPARIWLARIYGLNHLPDKMFDVLRAPLERPQDFPGNVSDNKELNMLESAAYFQKNDSANGTRLLEMEVSRNPTNQNLLTTVEQIYINRRMFTNALAITDSKLRLSPNDPNSLFTKGYIYNQLKKYNDAIVTLNSVLAIQKDNANALFQLANAYFGNGDLDVARADYEKLQQLHTNSTQIAFSLQEIAWRQHDTNEAIRNIQIYLDHAPTNAPQTRIVAERLRELKQRIADK